MKIKASQFHNLIVCNHNDHFGQHLYAFSCKIDINFRLCDVKLKCEDTSFQQSLSSLIGLIQYT